MATLSWATAGTTRCLAAPETTRSAGGDGNNYATGDDGANRLFLRDGLIDRWCDSGPLTLEVDPSRTDPSPSGPIEFAGDHEVCPADEF